MARLARQLVRLSLLAVVIAVFSHTRADPDLWGHVRFGQDTFATRALTSVDPYSFASDRPWVNHEWLAEIAMYLAYAGAGGAGLIALKVALLVTMLALVLVALPNGMAARTKELLIGLVVIGTVPQANHVRPQLFSLVLFAALLATLGAPNQHVRSRRVALAFVRCLVMAVWANLHGGWIVGALVLGVWGGFEALSGGSPAKRIVAVIETTAPILATLANPYGLGLWTFLSATVGFGRDQITDWQPVYRLGLGSVLTWLLVLGAAVAISWQPVKRRSIDFRAVAVVMILGYGSFRVSRLLAFFAIAVTSLLGRYIAQERKSPSHVQISSKKPMDIATATALTVAAILTIGCARIVFDNVSCVRMEPTMFPEAAVAGFVQSHGLHGRMLIWFDWGEYAIWYFPSGLSVSIDGRRETVYSDSAIQQQFRFYFAPDRRHSVIEALKPDYVWLPARLEVTHLLASDGWNVMFAGSQSVLLSKQPTEGFTTGALAQAPRCFPGP